MISILENICSQVASIIIPGADITSIAVYEKNNKLFVADDDHECIYVINGYNNLIEDTIHSVGGAIFYMAVNETSGKLFAASDKDCCTTGVTPGLGLISVIDVVKNEIITQINPGPQGNISFFYMTNDEVHDRIYIHFYSGVGVIDAFTNNYTNIIKGLVNIYLVKFGINTATNEIFVPDISSGIYIINGNNLTTDFISYPTDVSQALDIAVNEAQNKVYMYMNQTPDNAGICIYNRTNGTFSYLGNGDMEPLVYNNSTGKLFSGVQIGLEGGIVDGVKDSLTYIDLSPGGIGAADIKYSTDRAYFASSNYTWIVDGAQKRVVKKMPSGLTCFGLVNTKICVNQNTNTVYVVNCGSSGIISVLQDYPTPEQAGTIEGKTSVCKGENNVIYTIPLIKNATSYIWTLPSGATGNSTTNSIAVNYNISAQPGNVTVKGINDGGEGLESTLAINIHTIPTITATTDASHCGTGAVKLEAIASAGTINWYSELSGGSSLGTGPSFTTPFLTSTTVYYVDATDNGCTTPTRRAITAKINCTGIINNHSSSIFKIYPNPTDGIIRISIDKSMYGDYIIELYNNIGRLLQKISIYENDNISKVDLSDYPPGIYFIKLHLKGDVFVHHLIKVSSP